VGTIEKYLSVTSVMDTCIDVSKRAAFGNCVSGMWAGGGGGGGGGALGWVRRLPGFMGESKILLGKMV
jgi:hypothetical protein